MHQTREIFENGKVTNYTGELRHLFETQNQKVCYEWLKSKIVKQEKVTPDLVCQIHERLCHGCYDETRWTKGERLGQFKKGFYGVGLDAGLPPTVIFDEDKETYYECLLVFDKTEKMDAFVQFLQEQTEKTWIQTRRTKTKGIIRTICL